MISRAVYGAFAGVFLGFFVTVFMAVATVAMSFLVESTVSIPYVIESSFEEAGGLPELYFTPNFPGMLGLIFTFGVVTMVCAIATGRRRHQRSGLTR